LKALEKALSALELWLLNHDGIWRRGSRCGNHLALVDDDGIDGQWLHGEAWLCGYAMLGDKRFDAGEGGMWRTQRGRHVYRSKMTGREEGNSPVPAEKERMWKS
jgi:hypothetical protein